MGYTELTEQFERREKMRGTALTILGGVFWGLAGVFGKYSFEHRGMTPQWLVNVRLIIARLILLSTVVAKQIGIAACQMTYYMAVDDSNAGIATVLQYVAPVIIMLYTSLVNRKLPEVSERIALVLAFGGVILIATHGDLTQLKVSKTTLFLGLASALANVFYNLLPGNLMSEYGTFAIVGWGMLISG